jgi:hypothetical protein
MNTMSTPAFTADASFYRTRNSYYAGYQPQKTIHATGVVASLGRGGGEGGGSAFWCDDSTGTCSCLGGSLSEDCWLMQQYCTGPLYCSPYSPYKCTCYYTLTRPPQISRGNIGSMGTRILGP